MAMSAEQKSETEQLTYGSETRDNFELENDPKLYVKDKYFYRNRRIKIGLYLFGGLLLMAAIIFLAVYLIGGHHQKAKNKNNWTVRRGSDSGPPTIISSNHSFLLANETSSKSQSPFIIDPTTLPTITTPKIELQEDRRRFIRDMALEAWDAYERHAWGHDALRPGSEDYSRLRYGLNSGLTIIASMSTLWLMNTTEQFRRGEEWITKNLNLSAMVESVSVQSTVQHYIGSLLSTQFTTGNKIFFGKAIEVANLLESAYNRTVSGLPYGQLKPSTGQPMGATLTLAELGGQHLEYTVLADMLVETHANLSESYRKRVTRIRNFFADQIKKFPDGLYRKLVYIEGPTGEWRTDVITLGKTGGNFYSYLLKAYLLSGGRDRQALDMFTDAMDALDRVGVFGRSAGGLVFARDFHLKDHLLGNYMTMDSCYLGGMLALAAHTLKNVRSSNSDPSTILGKDKAKQRGVRIQRYWTLAIELTRTCHEAALRSPSGLPPHHFYFDLTEEATNRKRSPQHRSYHLSSELAESYFILWRLTRQEKYREWAFELAQAISRYCREAGRNGFSGVRDVYNLSSSEGTLPTTNYQNADLLAATLKYLYLIFDGGDSDLPLDKWIFNGFGQPLPISY